MPLTYRKLYICPIREKCNNHDCFMYTLHTARDYYRVLKGKFKGIMDRFNEAFWCCGQKLKLEEFEYKRGE